jgi:tetratricopeptide (TPR) repeat protein
MRGLRRRVLAAVAVLCLPPATASASTPAGIFEKANEAYEAGRYEEAASGYETILGYGLKDPRVLYNLGNCEFKMGHLGQAILNYERALRFDPSDQDVRDNLEFARGRIRDRMPEPEVPYPVQALQGTLDSISSGLMSGIFLGIYLVTATLAGVLILERDGVRRRALAYVLAGAGLALLAASGGLAYKVREDTASHAIVMEDRVDVRSGPAEDNTVLFTVHEGTRLEVRNRLDGWWQVSLPNALSGWIPAMSVEQV